MYALKRLRSISFPKPQHNNEIDDIDIFAHIKSVAAMLTVKNKTKKWTSIFLQSPIKV